MSERYDGLDEDFEVWVETHTRTTRGARDSLGGMAGMGPPIEPDYEDYRVEIEKVIIMGVDVTDSFDTSTLFDDENGELYDHIQDVIKKAFGV